MRVIREWDDSNEQENSLSSKRNLASQSEIRIDENHQVTNDLAF